MAYAAVQSAPPQTGMGPYTWDDFVALPDDDKRELIDGYLLEADVATEMHEYVTACLIGMLWQWAQTNGGKVLAAAYKVKVTDRRGVMPDVQYYRPGRKNPAQGLTEGAPDLAVEIVSESSRRIDRVTKLRYYQQIGTPEYWLIDPEEQTLLRFVLVDSADGMLWQTTHALTVEDGQFAPPSFAGMTIDLQRLFTLPE